MHPTDDIWLGWMDGELDARAEERVASHLRGCSECRAAAAAVFARQNDMRELLDELVPRRATNDTAMLEAMVRRGRHRRWRRGAVIAASVLFTVIGSAAAAARSPSIRHFVRTLFVRSPGSIPAAPRAPAATTNGVAVPAGRVVDIRFRSGQATGVITVILEDGVTAAIAASDSVGYLIRPDGVVILNEGSRASYTLTLPVEASQATIRIGELVVFRKLGRAVEVVGAIDSSHRYVIPLAQRRSLGPSHKVGRFAP